MRVQLGPTSRTRRQRRHNEQASTIVDSVGPCTCTPQNAIHRHIPDRRRMWKPAVNDPDHADTNSRQPCRSIAIVLGSRRPVGAKPDQHQQHTPAAPRASSPAPHTILPAPNLARSLPVVTRGQRTAPAPGRQTPSSLCTRAPPGRIRTKAPPVGAPRRQRHRRQDLAEPERAGTTTTRAPLAQPSTPWLGALQTPPPATSHRALPPAHHHRPKQTPRASLQRARGEGAQPPPTPTGPPPVLLYI